MYSQTSKNATDFNYIENTNYLDQNYKDKTDSKKLQAMGFSNGGSFVYKILTYNNNLPLNYRFSFVIVAGNMLVELKDIIDNYNFENILIIHDIYDPISSFTTNNDALG